MKKILIILPDKLEEAAEYTSGANYLNQSFKIEFVICKSWAWEIKNKELDEYFSNTKSMYQHQFADDFLHLKKIISGSNADFVIDLTNNSFSDEIYKFVKKSKIKYVLIRNGHVHASFLTRLFLSFKKIKFKLSKKNYSDISNNKNNEDTINNNSVFSKIFKFVKKKIKYETTKLKADIALVAGAKVLELFDKKTIDIIHIGSHDYYVFKKNEKKIQTKKRKFILFIDTLLVSEIEKVAQKFDPIFSESEFKKFHNIVFGHFENHFNLPVVIAGHRRGKDIKNYENLFSGREVIFDNTPSLVKKSEFVIASFSTAISFAVLEYKPIFIYTNANMDACVWGSVLYARAKELGLKIIDFEKKIIKLPNDYNFVDKKKYNQFILNYLNYNNDNFKEKFPFENFIIKYK
tara:strand:- start:5458 stop:6672 length:1215 start_codon:yes stop_codon:yes gene_type:complete